MISIVLPTYNGEKYIKEAVTSILCQTYEDWELIVVDDCSTDHTPQILESLQKQDKRIRVLHNEQNKKLPASLNIGFAEASGEYLTWTSDDNKYESNALEVMLAVLHKEPDIDIVYAYYDLIDADGKVISDQRHTEKLEKDDINQIMENTEEGIENWVGACFLYRREVQERLGGYDETLFLAEDFDFWLRALRHFQYKQIRQSLYQYRYHPASLTSARHQEIMEKHVEIILRELTEGYIPEKKKYGCLKRAAWICCLYENEKYYKIVYKELEDVCRKEGRKLPFTYRLAHIIGTKKTKIIKNIF